MSNFNGMQEYFNLNRYAPMGFTTLGTDSMTIRMETNERNSENMLYPPNSYSEKGTLMHHHYHSEIKD